MDMATMKRLFNFANSIKPKEYGPMSQKHKAENPSEWAGQRIRMMLYLLYHISMLCLLCFDVVFQIKDLSVDNHWQNVTPESLAQVGKLRPEHFHIQLNLCYSSARLNTISTDLVVFLFFSYLIRLTYNSHTVPYASLFISHPCLKHSSLHSSLYSAWLSSSLLLFHSATAVWLLHVSLPFQGYA